MANMLCVTLKCFLSILSVPNMCFSTDYDQVGNVVQPQVTILQGTLLGVTLTSRHGRNISAFMGIPYAQSPIGNLRFANPVKANHWNGILNASTERSHCPEHLANGEMAGNEDCLYLNAYTPQIQDSRLFPVMVYVHGGGFRGNFPGPSGPEYLLDVDVVLVTLNYRLGALGFLSTGDKVASGNWGLKDQVLALKWVQNNIRYFGGDPDQVTLFGESAGAGSVHLMSLSDTTIGLFHRYITQSGSAWAPWAHRPKTAYSSTAFELGTFVGCHNDTSDSLINCLREIDFIDIMGAESQFKLWEFLPDVMWGPTDEPDIEGAFMTDNPSNLLATGNIRDIPHMSGVTRDEGLLYSSKFYKNEVMLDDFLENIDTLLPHLLFWIYEPYSQKSLFNATKSHYFNNYLSANRSLILKNLTSLLSDVYFIYPVYATVRQQHAVAVNPPYFYSFEYRGTHSFSYTFSGSTANYGVAHSDDLIYLFPKESEFADLNKAKSQSDSEMIDTMIQLWTSFATNGTPTALALGTTIWEPYSTEGNYLRIGSDSDTTLEVQYSFYKERMDFWDDVYGALKTQKD